LQSTSSTHEVLQLAISLDKKNWVKVINIAASKNYDMLVHFRKTKTAYLRNYYILQSERRLKRIDKLWTCMLCAYIFLSEGKSFYAMWSQHHIITLPLSHLLVALTECSLRAGNTRWWLGAQQCPFRTRPSARLAHSI